MSTALLTPPIAALTPPPKPFRWTIDEYRSLDKTGLFHDVKTMLLDGELYVMAMPSPPHNFTMIRTERFLRSAFNDETRTHIRNQMGFDIGTSNDPGPDLAVIAGLPEDYLTANPTTAIMIVEVAVTSRTMDTTTKAELYATAEVPEYWVIDVPGRELHIYRDPVAQPAGLGADAYRTRQVFGPSDTVSPLAIPSASIKVADLLP